jgi:hypothetical protein
MMYGARVTPVATVPERPLSATAETPPRTTIAARNGAVAVWALVGLGLAAIAVTTWVRWILSGDEFGAVPVLGPDHYATWREVALRITEALSVVEMGVLLWFVAIRPLRRTGRLGLDAKITAGCLLGCVSDGFLNGQQYLFAWNQHSVDLGSWSSFLPFASPDHQSRYAEALLWGTPMYTYFCIGVGFAGVAVVRRLRARRPDISNAAALGVVFAGACVFDFVMENAIVRLDHAYAFVKTPESITFFAGSQYQFPVYEMLAVAGLGVFFTYLRLSAFDSADGLSWPERGIARLRPSLRGPASWLAVIGASMTALIVIYHVPFQLFGLIGDSVAPLPSYMLPTG